KALEPTTHEMPDSLRKALEPNTHEIPDSLRKALEPLEGPMTPAKPALENSSKASADKVITNNSDGSYLVEYKDNSTYTVMADGRTYFRHPNGDSESFDKDGHLVSRHERLSDGTQLTMDAKGRLTGVISRSMDYHAGFDYDASGNLTKVTGTV